ncbi:hypothetical protein PMZ80_002228 [Knufia obscura]|uniref:Rhodopsin domain-containing protein n=2 Tax=Knufia TaxID=430999 RepID=A0AAN8EFW8_9EURO|nr:hypothetical protein PMZ80_002228 [Knufia obscura]KAK5950588.1 hypothetical protein OHC33_008254 [Knufia fluminis]
MANTLTAPKWVQDSWPPPNYEDPETQGRSLEYVSIAFNAFGIVVVFLRCYSRIYLTKAFGLDDGLIIVALLSCIALSVLLIFGIERWYLGYHIWDLPADSVVDHRKGMWMASFITIWSSGLIRISVLLFYRRLSTSFTRGFLIATWLGIAHNVCIMVAFTMANALICSPVKSFWRRYDLGWNSSHNWKCGNEGISLPASGINTVLADIYCTVLPLALVVTLKIPRRQKIALYYLFGLGFLACGAAIARVTYLCRLLWKSWDFTWMVYDMWIWNVVELYIGIFVACAPSLKPLVRSIMGGKFLGYMYGEGTRHSKAIGRPENNMRHHARGNVLSTSASRQWIVSGGHGKGAGTTTTITSVINDEERQSGSKRALFFRPASMFSTSSSLDKDRVSVESFPARKPRHTRILSATSPIPEEGITPPLAQEVEVDPPIYPVAALRRPKSNRSSQLVGDGLVSPMRKHSVSDAHVPTRLQTYQDSYGGISDSSPVPVSNQYLSKDGWVELNAVKRTDSRGSMRSPPGSVKAARVKAGAQNESRILQSSPTDSQATSKPYYDAESSHRIGFSPTTLPKTVYEPGKRSEEMTRLDYSSSSSDDPSTTDLVQFRLEVSQRGSGSSITALPQQRRR